MNATNEERVSIFCTDEKSKKGEMNNYEEKEEADRFNSQKKAK